MQRFCQSDHQTQRKRQSNARSKCQTITYSKRCIMIEKSHKVVHVKKFKISLANASGYSLQTQFEIISL